MGLTITTDVFCDGTNADGHDCGSWFGGPSKTTTQGKKARAQARECGWAVGQSGGKDYCPRHNTLSAHPEWNEPPADETEGETR